MSAPRQDDDTERDAWLSEALRHAPDAQAAPPAALSDAILRQARAATHAAGTSATARPRPAWLMAWDWLARPPVAAGFASVMVATLVGLIWWDQPIDPNLARPPAADASPAAAPAPVQPAPVATRVPSAAPAAADVAQQGTAQAESAPPAESKRAAPKPVPVPRPAPASVPQRSKAEPAPSGESRAVADAAPSAREGLAAPAPAAAATPSPPAMASPPAAAMRLRDASPAAAESAKAAAPAMQRRENADSPRPVALAALLASVAAQPQRWQWQRGGAMQPMSPALQRWLSRLDAATVTRWRSTADTASTGEATVLRLYRDGALTATLRLDDDSVALGPASRATLSAGEITALKRALDDAAP